MKTFVSTRGPFPERPYYELNDIEIICSDELRAVGLYPKAPAAIRIDRFVEKRFGVTPEYDNLPESVLGYTKFGTKGVEKVVVSRLLSDEGSKMSERRINTTLAHEAGHGLLHMHLFALGIQPKRLFGEGDDLPRVLCRDIPGTKQEAKPAYSGRWWEHQANLAMGALLLPRSLVETVLAVFMIKDGSLGMQTVDNPRRDTAVLSLSEVFDVNPVVARIRLEQIYPEEPQLRL